MTETFPIRMTIQVPVGMYRELAEKHPKDVVGPILAASIGIALRKQAERARRNASKRPYRRTTPEQLADLVELVDAGVALTVAAEQVGISCSTAWKALQRERTSKADA